VEVGAEDVVLMVDVEVVVVGMRRLLKAMQNSDTQSNDTQNNDTQLGFQQ